MKTYIQKEAWVLNKRTGTLVNGTLLLDGDSPVRLVAVNKSFEINDYYAVYYSKGEAAEAREKYYIDIKELCAKTKQNIKKLDGIWLESLKKSDYLPDELLNRKGYEGK